MINLNRVSQTQTHMMSTHNSDEWRPQWRHSKCSVGSLPHFGPDNHSTVTFHDKSPKSLCHSWNGSPTRSTRCASATEQRKQRLQHLGRNQPTIEVRCGTHRCDLGSQNVELKKKMLGTCGTHILIMLSSGQQVRFQPFWNFPFETSQDHSRV